MTRQEIYKYAIAELGDQIARLKGYRPNRQEMEEIIDDIIITRLPPECEITD